ncbi:TPA: hypothetical protein QCH88_004252 [Enterobacter asburiae]|nr:hypothetical protein EspYZU15_85 [Cronobacter phage EspYZU15]WAK45491.1 hypothetical protein EspYZU14_87 [Cronobacter phage EspYZU14]WBF78274.1 hypothetical protein [Cronobacter phage EspYZU12]WNT48131.1 hypothetical protein SPLA5a_PHROGS00048 [Salmonella phage SPLA5a]HDR2377013.1 hypothetical protein [Enterobacter asburiae]
MTTSTSFIFVVDTDSYSGNFEREMCAHITGQIGECGVGAEYRDDVEDLKEDHYDFDIEKICDWLERNVSQVADEHACYRPCAIWPTPGRTNNGNGVHSDITDENPLKWPAYESVAIFLKQEPPEDVARFMVIRANTFQEKPSKWSTPKKIKVKGCRLVKETTVITEESKSLDFPLDF